MTMRPYLMRLSLGLGLLSGLVSANSLAQVPRWQPIGISGGGGMFAPAISPANPNLMMLNCDMSAAYISEDGGRNWRMIHHAQLVSSRILSAGRSRSIHPIQRSSWPARAEAVAGSHATTGRLGGPSMNCPSRTFNGSSLIPPTTP